MTQSRPSKLPLANGPHETFDFASFEEEFGGTTFFKMKAGFIVYRQGEPAEDLFYLQRGRIRINVVSHRGKEAIMAMLGDATVFGETCLLGESVRMATATCLDACDVVRIERSHAIRALQSSAQFAEFILTCSLRRIVRLRGRLISQLFDSSEQRLARILLTLANYGRGDWKETTIDGLDQEDLAQMVGTTRARVSLFMNKFRRLGYIDYNGVIAVYRSLADALSNDAFHDLEEPPKSTPAIEIC